MKKLYILLFAICAISLFNSCDTESEISFLESAEDLGFTGSQEDIINFLSQETYNSLLELGIPINTGSTPPNVEGVFRMSPNVLENSNIVDESFEIGHQFADQILYFSNQDQEELSIDYSGRQVDGNNNVINTETGLISYISGNGNSFTVIIKIEATSTDSAGNQVITVQGIVISGTITATGIQNARKAFVIIEKTGDVNDEFIDEGEGRLLKDEDGFSNRE